MHWGKKLQSNLSYQLQLQQQINSAITRMDAICWIISLETYWCHYYDYFLHRIVLWCAQTAAYSGQCHTTQGNPYYIGVNFGVKTLEEEANTAGVDIKSKFYQWNESNDYYVSCDCDKDNVEVADGDHRRGFTVSLFRRQLVQN